MGNEDTFLTKQIFNVHCVQFSMFWENETIFSCKICKYSCKIETIDMASAIEVSDERAPEILPNEILLKCFIESLLYNI